MVIPVSPLLSTTGLGGCIVGSPWLPSPEFSAKRGGWFLPRIRKVCLPKGELFHKIESISSLEVIK